VALFRLRPIGVRVCGSTLTTASRKLPAALCIANLANNKQLRVKLVKHKAYQLFVEMAKVPSARKDMVEYQRVAALGLKNLASSFDLRSLAAKVGLYKPNPVSPIA
jgi:hypothetical protein